jgi:peptidylprolyl isomerase
MKSRLLYFCIATAVAAQAQTASKPATTATSTVHHSAAYSAVKLPPGIPPARGIVKTAVALRYQDIKIGTGPLGQDEQMWHVKYTGWRAADGVKFDSWEDHRKPVIGQDGKPEKGPDGKPVLGDPEPLVFAHGVGRVIPGFDAGLEGMRIGGKRRIFVPWLLAYGYHAIPDHGPDHPGIPAKSDLIFDVELVSVSDIPKPPAFMPRPGGPGYGPGQSGTIGRPTSPSTPPAATAPAKPAAPAQPAAPSTPPATTTPAKPATPQSN